MIKFIVMFGVLVSALGFAENSVQEMSKNIDPRWIHEIVGRVGPDWRYDYMIENETVWQLYDGKHWDQGDQILIIYDQERGTYQWDSELEMNFLIGRWTFFNITKNHTATGDAWNVYIRGSLLIPKVISFTDYYNTVVLSNGLRLHSEKDIDQLPAFIKWKKGDMVMQVSKKDSPHCLLNLETFEIASDLQIQQR